MSLTLISVPDDIMHCRNEMTVVIKTDLPLSTPNLKIQCFLAAETSWGSGLFYPPIPSVGQVLDPDENGKCKFFWNRYLLDSFENRYDLPPYQGTSPVEHTNLMQRYVMWAIELSGDPQEQTDVLFTGEIYEQRLAVNGGIAKERFALRSYFGINGWSILAENSGGLDRHFMDYRGADVRTRTEKDEWVSFIWQDPGDILGTIPIEIKVRYYLSDGTDATITFDTVNNWEPLQAYMLPAGHSQLSLSNYETSSVKVLKYDYWLAVPILGTVLSMVRTFTVDRDWYEWVTQLMYVNSLGVFCPVTLYGRPVDMADIDSSDVPQYYEQGYDIDKSESVQFDVAVAQGKGISSGRIDRSEKRLLLEMFSSRKVLLVVDDRSQQNIPIRITNKKWEDDRRANALRVDIEWVVDYDNTVPDMMAF